MSQENVPIMELRAHHLFSLAKLHLLGAHKGRVRAKLCRFLNRVEFKMAGSSYNADYANHLTDVCLSILQEKVDFVRIISSSDVVCANCQQKPNEFCRFGLVKCSKSLLSMYDEEIIRKTHGIIEIGCAYTPAYLIAHLETIWLALFKANFRLFDLWLIDKLVRYSNSDK